MLELILGGARSGKSRLAEQHAIASKKQLVYIATAEEGDAEMAQRIRQHRERRDNRWLVIEEPLELTAVLSREAAKDRCVVVDCLTLWVSNHLVNPAVWRKERKALFETLPSLPGDIILVGNEVGSGIVPLGHLTRQFVDENGWLHQGLAQICDRVTYAVAGLAHCLKDTSILENS